MAQSFGRARPPGAPLHFCSPAQSRAAAQPELRPPVRISRNQLDHFLKSFRVIRVFRDFKVITLNNFNWGGAKW